MGYHLRGLLLPASVVPPADLHSVILPQSLTLIPLPDDVLDALPEASLPVTPTAGFTHLTGPLEVLIGQLSQAGRVAYVEAEYFGGTGSQVAAVWDGGRVLWGLERGERGPVNHALRLLGVRRTDSHDEFGSVGLDRHRHLEDWLD